MPFLLRPKDKHNDTLVDDRLQLRNAKSDKNAKNARFAVERDAKSDKNGKNARFGDAPEAKSDKIGKNARFWEGRRRRKRGTGTIIRK